MTGSEKFNKITELIERRVENNESPDKISSKISKEFGISQRDLSTTFKFLTGKTLIEYIKERKIMISYEYIIDSKKFDIQTAIDKSGLGDQSAYSKNFKKFFGYTPKEAFNNKDNSLLKAKLSWNNLNDTEILDKTENKKTPKRLSKIFGVEHWKYIELLKLIDYSKLYSFNEPQSELAYSIYHIYKYPMDKAFRLVDELKYDKEIHSNITEEEYYNTEIKRIVSNPEFKYTYINTDVDSPYSALYVIERCHERGIEDVTKIDPMVLEICSYCSRDIIDILYCKKAIDYYREHATSEHGDDALNEYIEYILESIPIETAFDNIIKLEGWDDYSKYDFLTFDNYEDEILEEYEAFEKWADEETNFYNY